MFCYNLNHWARLIPESRTRHLVAQLPFYDGLSFDEVVMILVSYRGYGEWFYRGGDSIRLAIKRTTKKPYRESSMFWILNGDYCPYHEWLEGESTPEKISEWKNLYKDAINEIRKEQNQSEDHEYNYDLKGIFVRDHNAKGDVYDTDGLRSFGANYIECEFTQGVFRLNDEDEDEEACELLSFELIKNEIKTLLPCSHPKSAFSKMINKKRLSNSDVNQCFFQIQSEQYFDFWGKTKPLKQNYSLELINADKNSLTEDQVEKLKSLEKFIIQFGIARKNLGLDFDPKYMKCNENDLLIAIKKWAKDRDKETQELWNITKLSNLDIWPSKRRKEICKLLPCGHSREREEDFFEIVGF